MMRAILLLALVAAQVFAIRNNSKLSGEKFNVFPYYAFNSTADNATSVKDKPVKVSLKNTNYMSLDVTVEKWNKNDIPYFYATDLLERTKPLVEEAVKYYKENTCLRFREITAKEAATRPHIRIVNLGVGLCNSYIGLGIDPRARTLSLGEGCLWIFTVLHELGHAVGFRHAQWRHDRDEHVDVNLDNVENDKKHNYYKGQKDENENYDLPYDYLSIMQYEDGGFALDKSKSTMQPKNPLYKKSMGTNFELSFVDRKMLNKHYNCDESCEKKMKCQNGGFQNSNKCDECVCPIGFGGRECGERADDCGETLHATDSWQELYVGTTINTLGYNKRSCTWWIEAEKDERVAITIDKVLDRNDVNCRNTGIHVKVDNPLVTGFIVCKKSMIPDVYPIISEKNRVIIHSYNYDNEAYGFYIRYRRVAKKDWLSDD